MTELLNRDDILRYLLEVAEELPDTAPEAVVIVGGSMLACRELREATRDVDSARIMSQQLVGAARRVAARHDLTPTWLNSHAAAFVPNGDVDIIDPDPVLITKTLVVFTATADACNEALENLEPSGFGGFICFGVGNCDAMDDCGETFRVDSDVVEEFQWLVRFLEPES